jgi:hypothetical protein
MVFPRLAGQVGDFDEAPARFPVNSAERAAEAAGAIT